MSSNAQTSPPASAGPGSFCNSSGRKEAAHIFVSWGNPSWSSRLLPKIRHSMWGWATPPAPDAYVRQSQLLGSGHGLF